MASVSIYAVIGHLKKLDPLGERVEVLSLQLLACQLVCLKLFRHTLFDKEMFKVDNTQIKIDGVVFSNSKIKAKLINNPFASRIINAVFRCLHPMAPIRRLLNDLSKKELITKEHLTRLALRLDTSEIENAMGMHTERTCLKEHRVMFDDNYTTDIQHLSNMFALFG